MSRNIKLFIAAVIIAFSVGAAIFFAQVLLSN